MNPSAKEPAGAPEPQAWQRIAVVLLAVVFFLTPYLFDSRTGEKDSLGADLVGDGLVLVTSHEALQEAQTERSLGALAGTLTTGWWGSITGGQALWRPIPSLLLGVAGAAGDAPYSEAAPGDNTFPYHVIALALNVLCALLVMELAWLVFKSARAAFVSGALFATLPIHGEVIYDVAGIAELSATAFSLMAWTAWIRAGDRPFARPGQLALSLLCLFLATLSKESAFALPLVFFLFDLRGGKEGGLGAGVSHALSKLPALVACGVVLGVSLFLRYQVLGTVLPTYVAQHTLDNPLLFQGFLTRFMNALRVLAGGTAAVFGVNALSSNWNYSPDYSLNQIPVLGAFSLWNLVGAAAVAGALVLAVTFYRKCRTRAALVFAFFGATLLTSNLLTPVGTIYADRLMFFPSVAAVMLLAGFLAKRGTVGVALGLLLALGGGYWNWWNGKDHWTSQTDLWGYATAKAAPNSARAQYNNAVDAFTDQVYGLAVRDLEKAIAIHPGYAQALALLGDLHTLPQEYDLHVAVDNYERACEVQLEDFDYDYPPEPLIGVDSFGPRAMLYKLTRLRLYQEEVYDPEGHLAWLESLIESGYESAYVHHRRGETLLALGDVEGAEAAFRESLELESTPECVQALATLLLDLGRGQEALTLLNGVREFRSPAERVAVLLARAEAEFADSPEKVLATADELWDLRNTLPQTGEYVFTPEQEFETLYLRARAKYAMWGPNPTPEQNEELTRIMRNAVGAYQVVTDDTFEASWFLAQLLTAQGLEDEARPILEALIVRRELPSLRLQLGNVYARLGRAVDALDQFTKIDANLVQAAEMFQDDPSFLQTLVTTRAMVLELNTQLGREADALAAIDAWHEAAPGEYDPVALLVQAYWELSRGGLDSALELADTLRQAFPEDPRGAQLEKDLLAVRELERKVEGSTDPSAFEELAALRRRMRYYEGALEMAERAVDLTDAAKPMDLARRLALLAACHESLGDLQAAIDTVRRAQELEVTEEDQAAMKREIRRLEKRLAG